MAKAKSEETKAATIVTSGAKAAEATELIKSTLAATKETRFIPTGNIGFDFALTPEGKGLPLGASILLWADPSSGKSTLLADISKRLLDSSKRTNTPFKVLYIAAEGSRELMMEMGLRKYMDSHDFIYVERALTWRQVEMLYNAILNKHPEYKDVKVVIIDSVNNILSDANVEKSAADGDFGTRAKERSTFYSKYLPLCKEHEINTFLISQVRHNQETAGMMYGDKKKAAVSYADKHNVDVILKCSKRSASSELEAGEEFTPTLFDLKHKNTERFIIKLASDATDCKNRYCSGFPSEVFMIKGKGAENTYVVRKLLEVNKLVKSGGGWYSFSDEIVGALELPTGNLRKDAFLSAIKSNLGRIVKYLKEEGLYTLLVKDRTSAQEETIEPSEETKFADSILKESSEITEVPEEKPAEKKGSKKGTK